MVCLVYSVGVSVAEVLTFEMNFDHVIKNNIGRVQCEGEENKLFECPSGESCILGYGAGVKCYNGNFIMKVRLTIFLCLSTHAHTDAAAINFRL